MDPIRLLIEPPPERVCISWGEDEGSRTYSVVFGVGGCFYFFFLLDGIFDLDHLALSFFSIFSIPAYLCVYSSRHVSRRRVCDLGILGWVDIVFFFCLIIVFS